MKLLKTKKHPETAGNDPAMGPDHSLALALAGEMARMQTNLQHMDPAMRGVRQLSRSLERMRNHLLAAGYEIVDMMGQPYSDGMKVVATFVVDEQMAPDEPPRITAVSRPQVNFRGVMIQVAEITVSQGI